MHTPAIDLSTWRADRQRRMDAMHERLASYLTHPEHTVSEHWDSETGHHEVIWYRGSGHFVEPMDSDALYLATHLVNRHFGFGYTLEIHGQHWTDGRLHMGDR